MEKTHTPRENHTQGQKSRIRKTMHKGKKAHKGKPRKEKTRNKKTQHNEQTHRETTHREKLHKDKQSYKENCIIKKTRKDTMQKT